MNKVSVWQCECGKFFDSNDVANNVKTQIDGKNRCPVCGSSLNMKIGTYDVDLVCEKQLYDKVMGL